MPEEAPVTIARRPDRSTSVRTSSAVERSSNGVDSGGEALGITHPSNGRYFNSSVLRLSNRPNATHPKKRTTTTMTAIQTTLIVAGSIERPAFVCL